MIPRVDNNDMQSDFTFQEPSSKTYKLALDSKRITGHVDGLEAIKQAIYKILNTERYRYLVYSWNYGIELADLFGKPTSLVQPEIERRITEALTQDTRILSVDAFSFEASKGKVHTKFIVSTIFGDVAVDKEVTV